MPEIKPLQAFMHALDTNKFNYNSIKHEQARKETPLSHYKSIGNFSDTKGKLINSKKSELARFQTHPMSLIHAS